MLGHRVHRHTEKANETGHASQCSSAGPETLELWVVPPSTQISHAVTRSSFAVPTRPVLSGSRISLSSNTQIRPLSSQPVPIHPPSKSQKSVLSGQPCGAEKRTTIPSSGPPLQVSGPEPRQRPQALPAPPLFRTASGTSTTEQQPSHRKGDEQVRPVSFVI